MKKLIHLAFYDPKFIPYQILALNKWFSDVSQTFFLYGAPKDYLKQAPNNVKPFSRSRFHSFIEEANDANLIVFDSLFSPLIPVLFSRVPEVVQKGVWRPWGGDLYAHQHWGDSPQSRLEMAFRRQFIVQLYGIVSPLRGDYEMVRTWYRTRAKYIDAAPHIFSFEKGDLDHCIAEKRRKDSVAIQLGNSASPSNEHHEMFEWFIQHNSEDFRLYVPLSYGSGDRNYIDNVISHGTELFGDQFIPMNRFMSQEAYNRHLASVDVLVFNHRRQQGFGNIAISLYVGTKVFLRCDVTTWPYLTEKLECCVFDTKTLPALSFDALVEMPDSARKQNRQKAAVLFDRDRQRAMWQRLYDA